MILEDLRYSEDVKDSISVAERLAHKGNRPTPTDCDYFEALLLTHRRFNRLDGLLSELNLSAKGLKKALKQASSTEPAVELPSELLKTAEKMAAEKVTTGAIQPHASGSLEVEHLLKACCLSPDPVVSKVIASNRLTPDAVDTAVVAAQKKQVGRNVLFVGKELLEVVAFVLFFLIVMKSFLGELRLIPSESMIPALQVNDRLVIERVTRGFRPYQRGDVLVFYPPMTQLEYDPWSLFMRLTGLSGMMYKKEDNIDVAYIKRLIGLPGDIVDVRPGAGVFVNGKKLDEPYVNEIANTCTQVRPVPYCGPIKVPPHSYYMMGDNRNLSLDSRYWGFASEDRVIGRAVFRIWPPKRVGALTPAPYQQEH